MEHLFCYCPQAQDLVSWWYNLMRQHSSHIPRPSEWEMLFVYRRVLSVPAGFVALLGIIRHQLWCTRNHHRFEGVPPSSAATLAKIKSSFRFLARVSAASLWSNAFCIMLACQRCPWVRQFVWRSLLRHAFAIAMLPYLIRRAPSRTFV